MSSNIKIQGVIISTDDDNDLITLSSGEVTIAGTTNMTTLELGGSAVTSTATELNYVDTTAGTATASKAIVLDANKKIATITHLTASYLSAAYLSTHSGSFVFMTGSYLSASYGQFANLVVHGSTFTLGDAAIDATEIAVLDSVTAGTAAANKAVILDGSKNISTIGNIGCGTLTCTSLDASDGNITNVGDINCDSVSVDAAGTGLNVDFSGANTGTGLITIGNNLAAALTIKSGSTAMVTYATTEDEPEILYHSDVALKVSGTFLMMDDADAHFGQSEDTSIKYDSNDNMLIISGSNLGTQITGSVRINGPFATVNTHFSSILSVQNEGDTLTSGSLGDFYSNSDSPGTRSLVVIHNDHIDAYRTTVLEVKNDSSGSDSYGLDVTAANNTFVSSLASSPVVEVSNNADDATAGAIHFMMLRNGDSTGVGADGDDIGSIIFEAKNDGASNSDVGEEVEFVKLLAEVTDATDANEDGKLTVTAYVAGSAVNVVVINDGTYGLTLQNNSAHGTVKANAFITYSDETLKSNITTLKNPIDKIMKLRGVSYDWNSDGTHDIGFIAQEVKDVVPELVYGSPGAGGYGLDYGSLTALLAEAIKEQQKEISQLKKLVKKFSNN